MPKPLLMMAAFGALMASALVPAVAQVTYAPRDQSFFGFFDQPVDESSSTRPSYQIVPGAYDYYGQPVVRVIHRCAYLGGWNVGDFIQDLNGTPLGADHTCPDDSASARVRARY